jgi:chemotaxis protein methyltransferase CheR
MTPAELRALSAASDLDLARFRPAHVEARVARAMDRAGAGDVTELGIAMRRDETVRADFRRSVAISVTGFFRDAEQFEHLERHMGWLRQTPRPRVWSAGCSNGAELWTLAVLLDRLGAAQRAQLVGSDLLPENIARAREGLDDGLLAGHTLPVDTRPFFEVRDLTAGAMAPGPWHLILCRNVAIYFDPEARTKLHRDLAASLAPNGLLLLGRSERIAAPETLGLESVAPHLYRRR